MDIGLNMRMNQVMIVIAVMNLPIGQVKGNAIGVEEKGIIRQTVLPHAMSKDTHSTNHMI